MEAGTNGQVAAKIAWGDESVRTTATPPMCLMAATILPEDPRAANQLRTLLPKSARKLHWRDMSTKLQSKSMLAIAGIEQSTLIALVAPIDIRKTERARRKCLETLLPDLEEMGVNSFILESRGSERDRNDIRFIDAIRQRHLIERIRAKHRAAEGEPRLWVPDQILGAAGDIRALPQQPKAWLEAWKALEGSIEIKSTRP